MKQKLLKTIGLALLCVVGASNAWAQTNISPTSDMFFRTSLSNSTYSWSSGYPKANGFGLGTNTDEMAGNHRAGMFVLQKYEVANLAAAKSIVLHLHRVSGGDAIAVWVFSTNDWSQSSDASTMATAVNTIVGLDLNKTGTPSNTPLVNGGSNNDDSQFTISGDNLTTLKNAATYDGTTGTFTLLLTNKTADMSNSSSSDRKFYGSSTSTEANRPYIAVTYDVAGVTTATSKTNYSSINSAISALPTDVDATLTIMESGNFSNRINAVSGHTLNVVAGVDNVTITNDGSNALSFLANATQNGTLNIGSADHALTVVNKNSTTNNVVELSGSNASAVINITNVTFSNITSSNASGIIKANGTGSVGVLTLTDVTFNNCTVSAANAGLIHCTTNDKVAISGSLTITNCSGNDFNLKGRINESSFTPSKTYTIYSDNISLGQSAVTKMNAANRGNYRLVNADRCVVGKGNSSNEELVVSEAYTLSVSAANAATLIIPFATTIPDGVACYTLTYSSGDAVTATPVETTLAANTPVLVNATEGTYKFNASMRATSSTAASTEGTHTVGALTGVYTEMTPGTGHYILTNHSGKVGFRKTVATSKVAAYRAYLTAGSSAPDFLNIDFDGNTTGLDEKVAVKKNTDGQYYNLNGQRVQNPTKGLYIVNGKKVIIK